MESMEKIYKRGLQGFYSQSYYCVYCPFSCIMGHNFKSEIYPSNQKTKWDRYCKLKSHPDRRSERKQIFVFSVDASLVQIRKPKLSGISTYHKLINRLKETKPTRRNNAVPTARNKAPPVLKHDQPP